MSVTELPTMTLSAGRAIARALTPAEDAIDTSLLTGAALLQTIIEGRLQTGVALELVHDAVQNALASISALGIARDHAVRCHQQLARTRDVLGFSETDFGCTATKVVEPERENAREAA
jgi:hypothetical protein